MKANRQWTCLLFCLIVLVLHSCRVLAFDATPDDLHLHLNGSVSVEFLKEAAARNNKIVEFQAFAKLNQTMESQIEDKQWAALVKTIWKKFSLCHHIIQTHQDIKLATLDVIIKHPSHYLEIRTTPKSLDNQPLNAYIDAFIDGIYQGCKQSKDMKVVKGLLSIDRTQHNFDEALEIVALAAHYRDRKKPIVGIDISGNPSIQQRSLTGVWLEQVLAAALEAKLCVSIHFAEARHILEQNDSDTVLNVLTRWRAQFLQNNPDADPKTLFFGKVRLGHVVFPTSAQIKRIQTLNIPIEICPTCHLYIGWWEHHKKHPILAIYPKMNAPVVLGTDDALIFNTNILKEYEHLQHIYAKQSIHLSALQDLRFSANWR